MISKKGFIGIQVNWIFILIVGGIILIFFISIVTSQKDVSKEKFSKGVVNNLGAIISGAKVSSGTTSIIDIPDVDIILSCEKFSVGSGDKSYGNQFKSIVAFFPSLISGRELLTWSVGWDSPFKVTDVLYLTSPRIKYIIVYHSDVPETKDIALKLNSSLPEELTKEVIETVSISNLDDIPDTNNYRVKFVFIGAKVKNLKPQGQSVPFPLKNTMKKDQVSAIYIEIDKLDAHEIFFYKVNDQNKFEFDNPSEKSASFFNLPPVTPKEVGVEDVSQPLVYGAVFADNKEEYDCMARRAFTRLEYVGQVYKDRTDMIYSDIREGCKRLQTDVFSDFIDKVKECSNFYPSGTCEKEDVAGPTSTESISDMIGGLETLNKKLQLESCPLIY